LLTIQTNDINSEGRNCVNICRAILLAEDANVSLI